jgi:hypothetical protein
MVKITSDKMSQLSGKALFIYAYTASGFMGFERQSVAIVSATNANAVSSNKGFRSIQQDPVAFLSSSSGLSLNLVTKRISPRVQEGAVDLVRQKIDLNGNDPLGYLKNYLNPKTPGQIDTALSSTGVYTINKDISNTDYSKVLEKLDHLN